MDLTTSIALKHLAAVASRAKSGLLSTLEDAVHGKLLTAMEAKTYLAMGGVDPAGYEGDILDTAEETARRE